MCIGPKGGHFESLKFLGDLRNRFAHKLDAGLDDAAVNELWAKIAPGHQKLILEAYEKTGWKSGEAPLPEFGSLTPKSRFVLIAVVLKRLVEKAVVETRQTERPT